MAEKPEFIPVARPWLGTEESKAAERVILSGWVTQGPEVAAFEREFAEYLGARHACAVSSCTAALHVALLTAGVQPGDEVITVSHSFIATANSVRYCGAIPVFIDIEPRTFNMNPELIESAITERTRAILCVHQIGMPCDIFAINGIARRHGLLVIEDAACALGSEIQAGSGWQRIGAPHGDIACFSFHPRKLLTTGEGGMLVTERAEWDQQFRLLRQHGMSIPDSVRHSSTEVLRETFGMLGFNYRMSDIHAAVGREQLKRLPAAIERRRTIAARYDEMLTGIPGVGLPWEPPWARSNWQSYCVRLSPSCEQHQVMQTLLNQGIATRTGVMCAHRESAYSPGTWRCGGSPEACGGSQHYGHLLESEEAQDHCIILPLFHDLSENQQNKVARAVREACLQG